MCVKRTCWEGLFTNVIHVVLHSRMFSPLKIGDIYDLEHKTTNEGYTNLVHYLKYYLLIKVYKILTKAVNTLS